MPRMWYKKGGRTFGVPKEMKLSAVYPVAFCDLLVMKWMLHENIASPVPFAGDDLWSEKGWSAAVEEFNSLLGTNLLRPPLSESDDDLL